MSEDKKFPADTEVNYTLGPLVVAGTVSVNQNKVPKNFIRVMAGTFTTVWMEEYVEEVGEALDTQEIIDGLNEKVGIGEIKFPEGLLVRNVMTDEVGTVAEDTREGLSVVAHVKDETIDTHLVWEQRDVVPSLAAPKMDKDKSNSSVVVEPKVNLDKEIDFIPDVNKPTHYQNYYIKKLNHTEIKHKEVRIKFDPYRICDVLNIGGGAREQILKKAIRWDTKGHTVREVITEIQQACARQVEMLDEDGNDG